MTSQETNTTPVIDLSISRARIDEIDAQIIELFERRMHIAADVAAYKRATGKPVLDKAREAAKIDKATELASDEFKKFIPPLFSMMMEMSRAYQHSLLDDGSEGVVPAAIDEVAELPAAAHVAVQGVEGAYQHMPAASFLLTPILFSCPRSTPWPTLWKRGASNMAFCRSRIQRRVRSIVYMTCFTNAVCT